MAAGEAVSVETKVGSVKGIPSALLGWVVVAAIAAFMTWQTSVTTATKLDKIIDLSQQQIMILNKISDRLVVK